MIDEGSSRERVFSRLEGLFDTNFLEQKLVTVIGLGTGGSLAALELARCAVGRFRLVDFDVLKPHNIARHACGLSDLGRPKTEAVRDAILNINSNAKVECFNKNILDDPGFLKGIIEQSDIVLPCTDTERSKYVINKGLIDYWRTRGISIPAIYAGAYERAFGGDIIRVIPGETPCYDCIVGTVQQFSFMESKPKSVVEYTNLESAEGFQAEPGLCIDVHFIVLIQTKLALLTLLRDTSSQLEDIPYDFIFWGNRKEWIFNEPFKCVFANVEKRSNCVTCSDNYLIELGITEEQASKQVEELIKQLPTIPSNDETDDA